MISIFILQEISLRLGYYMRWPEHRMVLNDSADWSRGEINVNPDIIKNFWMPDILIHDLVRYKFKIVQILKSSQVSGRTL